MPRDPRLARPGRRHRDECAKMYALTGAVRCVYCGRFTSRDLPANHRLKAVCDHIVPRSLGGIDHHTNMLPACAQCNRNRGTKTIPQWLGTALAPPWAVPGWVCNPQPDGSGKPSRDWGI